MSDDLVDLLEHLKTKTQSFENDPTALKILASLSAYQAKHTGGTDDYDLEDPDDYDLNRSIGTFLADRTDTLTYAEPFLIKAVNENLLVFLYLVLVPCYLYDCIHWKYIF